MVSLISELGRGGSKRGEIVPGGDEGEEEGELHVDFGVWDRRCWCLELKMLLLMLSFCAASSHLIYSSIPYCF